MELNQLSPQAEVSRTAINTSVQQPALELEDLYCILQIEPNDSLIALELARRLCERNRLEEAVRILKNVIRIDYRFETVSRLAQVEYRLELLEEAFDHLQQAVLIAPDGGNELFDVFKTLGNIYVKRGDLESAEENYNKAFRLNPDSDSLHVNLGTLHIQRHDWEQATDRFRAALSLNPSNDKAWVGLALCHRMKGDWELAWGNLEAALEYNPLNEVALGLALEWSTHEGKEFRALDLIRNFLVEGGWNEKLSLAFAWLSYRRGETVHAKLELERILAVNPTNFQALSLADELRNSL